MVGNARASYLGVTADFPRKPDRLFFCVFVTYGFLAPTAQSLRNVLRGRGQPSEMAIDVAWKSLMSEVRSTFLGIDAATQNLLATP